MVLRIMKPGVARSANAALFFGLGLVCAAVVLSLIGRWLASTSAATGLNALASALALSRTGKWTVIAATSLLPLAVLIRLLLGTVWAERTRTIAMVAIGLGVLGGAIFNVRMFSAIDRSEAYTFRAAPSPTLAELAASMPDKFPASEVLVWLRQHAAGAELIARTEDLRSAGLAARRLLGVSHLQVRERKNVVLDVAIAGRQLQRFHVVGADKPLWIDTDQARPQARLCAVPTQEALLLVRLSDAAGCESMP